MTKLFLLLSLSWITLTGSAVVAHASAVVGKVTLKTSNGQFETDASNILVYLEHPDGKGFDMARLPAGRKELRSTNKEFAPLVVPVTAGSKVEFLNEDSIMHNAFSLSKAKQFDLGLYRKDSRQSVTFNTPGLVKVYCNIHEDMVAYIPVLDTPYYALTDAAGNFEIGNVPEGNYRISAWHRFAETARKPLSVRGAKASTVLELTETNVSIKHKNKWDKDYQNKY